MVAKDPMIYLPNGVGLLLAVFPLTLFCMFGVHAGAGTKRRDSIVSHLDAELYRPAAE
jgi:hypothetical protein